MIGNRITVIVDRPLGSRHPKFPDLIYPVNYGYVEGVFAGDGEAQDVYVLGVGKAVERFTGTVIAVIQRFNDNEEKWVAAPDGIRFSREEIEKQVWFMEQFFHSEIRMQKNGRRTLSVRFHILSRKNNQMEILCATRYRSTLNGRVI